jgi:hypothetical protein
MNWLLINNLISLGVGTIAGLWFVGLYTWRTAWWQEEHRAHLATFSIIVTLFYLLYSARTFADPSGSPGSSLTGFNVVRALLFDILTALVVWRLVLLLRSRRQDEIRHDLEDVAREGD